MQSAITNNDTQPTETIDNPNDEETHIFIIYESFLAYYSKLWKMYENKWLTLSSNNTLTVYKNKHSPKIIDTVDLNVYNEIIRIKNTTNLKKNDFQFQLKKSNDEQTCSDYKFRSNNEKALNKWMKYIGKCQGKEIDLKSVAETHEMQLQENDSNQVMRENEEMKIDRHPFKIDAAKRYSYIDPQSLKIAPPHCSAIENCEGLKRLAQTFQFYQEFNDQSCADKDMDKFIKYLMSNKEFVVNDYHHILHVHLNEDISSKNENYKAFQYIHDTLNNQIKHCNIANCAIYSRNNRQRETEKVFETGNDSQLSAYIDILDTIHCHFIHSVDVGYRIINPLANDKNNENIEKKRNNKQSMCHDSELFKLKTYLETKREGLTQIRGVNRVKTNKFMTTLTKKVAVAEEKQNENTMRKKLDYSFGQEYNYWVYQEYAQKRELSSKPKYSSIKEEVTMNKIYCIDKIAFDNALKKACLLWNASIQIKCIQSEILGSNYIYGIKSGQSIQADNVLSIILYTDYDILSNKFSSTFRKLDENNDSLERNREYWHWSKTLIETVNCFGIKMGETNIASFYHGVSAIYFNKFIARFNSPTSTTTKLQIATIFATNDGIILEMNLDEYGECLRYFNCAFVSCYGYESERLFIQPPHETYKLKFKSIRNMSTNENYKDIIRALTKWDQLFDINHINPDWNGTDIQVMNKIIEMVNGSVTDIPLYMKKTIMKGINMDRQKLDVETSAIPLGINIWVRLKGTRDYVLRFDIINKLFIGIQELQCLVTNLGVANCVSPPEMLPILDKINKIPGSKLKKIEITGNDGTGKVVYVSGFGTSYSPLCIGAGWKAQIVNASGNRKGNRERIQCEQIRFIRH